MAHPAGSSAELFILYPDESLWIESDKEFCAFCNALFDIMSMNGILSLCYAQGYSYMYLNTTDKIIYLKR